MRNATLAAALLTGVHAAAQPVASDVVVATVNKHPVYASEVQRIVRQSVKDRPVDEAARPAIEAQALEQAIDQRLVVNWLVRENQGVDEAEVEAAIKGLKSQADRVKVPFAEFLKQQATDEAGLRRELTWRLSWRQYLARQINDAALQKFFDAHRREFDGTQVRASHILFKLEASAAPDAVAQAVERARLLRQQIVGGKLTFADAATKHSQAPSSREGGDVGFFPRRGVMEEAFARAAFGLKQGEISEPVTTSFGVHLIQCTQVRPGRGQWSDVRDALQSALMVELFTSRAQAERKDASINYSGEAYHFKPGTRDIVSPPP